MILGRKISSLSWFLLDFYIFLQRHCRFVMKFVWKNTYYLPFVRFPLSTVKAVYRFYLLESQRAIDFEGPPCITDKVVLKTDLYNEANSLPYRGGILGNLKRTKIVFSVEIHAGMRELAKRNLRSKGVNACHGDIRALPFPNEIFDFVIDLSTLDHIDPADIAIVLSEYERVLKRVGKLVLMVWVNEDNSDVTMPAPNQDQGSGCQYFFSKENLIKEILCHFGIEKSDTIFSWPSLKGTLRLVRFICSKKNIWQYLMEDKYDYRIRPAADYLKDKVKDKIIVDLNCGHAPLLKYLPDTYKKYLGNDIRELFPTEHNGKCFFYLKKDNEFADTLSAVDILVVFGVGGYEISKQSVESATATQTIKTIIFKFRPSIIVLEAIKPYTPILKRIERYAIQYRYRRRHYLDLMPHGDANASQLANRVIFILELEEKTTSEEMTKEEAQNA